MQVTGAGNEEQLPLDVHYASAADWLRDRGKLSKHWQRELRTVRARIDKALIDARPTVPGASDVLRDEPVAFDEVQRVVQLLRDAGLDKRTMLGGYADPTMKAWAAIGALYGRDNLHVAELCQRLVHNATYELPAVRKELELAETSLQDAMRKRQDAVRALDLSRERLRAECAKLGISGRQPRVEIGLLTSALPKTFREASERVCAQRTFDAIGLYRAWSAACLARALEAAEATAAATAGGKAGGKGGGKGGGATGGAKAAAQAAAEATAGEPRAELVPALARAHAAGVLEIDASTIAEARRADGAEGARGAAGGGDGAAVAEIDWGFGGGEVDGANGEGGGGSAGVAEIDWGGAAEGGNVGTEAIEIDWGGAAEGGNVGTEAIEIDWGGAADGGNVGTEAIEIDWGGAAEGGNVGTEAIEIDWGGAAEGAVAEADGDADADAAGWIEVEASGEHDEASAASAASAGAPGAPAAAARALYENAQLREALVNDALELEAFLRQRLADERAADPQLLSALSAWPEFSTLQVGSAALLEMLSVVQAARERLDCARTRQLLLVQSSAAYADRLAAGVQQCIEHTLKVERKADEALERVATLRADKAAAMPRYAELVARTRAQKAALAAEISRIFGGRTANVMGEIGEAEG
ncbi:hypothetical protein KFE25_001720 [Diacronema lutheri]|uniref:Uncharacterized protein n=1 Tax=Diacronema lutheri TaxID=2081491 RepID=A0A8J5XK81_DIALT|nr:hypothetical protein KFE25_001720 [Diacronema lutheri]